VINSAVILQFMNFSMHLRKILCVRMPRLLYNRPSVYFNQRVSTVFIAAIDATKAYDGVCNLKLFNKLSDRIGYYTAGVVFARQAHSSSSCTVWRAS